MHHHPRHPTIIIVCTVQEDRHVVVSCLRSPDDAHSKFDACPPCFVAVYDGHNGDLASEIAKSKVRAVVDAAAGALLLLGCLWTPTTIVVRHPIQPDCCRFLESSLAIVVVGRKKSTQAQPLSCEPIAATCSAPYLRG